jgi:hypothetical protein
MICKEIFWERHAELDSVSPLVIDFETSSE